jgi:alanine racemase
VCSLEQAQEISAVASAEEPVELHVYVDTGMHRDGVGSHEVLDVLEELSTLKGLHIAGICTHLATSDVASDAYIAEQLDRFHTVLSRCERRGVTFAHIHAANTGAIWQAPESLFTLVRPGLSLYGYANPADSEVHLRPVMSITSRILSVRRLWPGETVSYGRRYMTTSETTIATVPIGYGDGYLRSLTGKAQCLIGGKHYPVVGTVCMDEVMVDVGNAPVHVGDEVVLLGIQANHEGMLQSIDATDLAQWAGTIPYEITTAMSARVPRVFTGDKGL